MAKDRSNDPTLIPDDEALKVLNGETDKQHRLRFRREGEALAALTHPNVVAVYDVVEHEGNVVLVTAALYIHRWAASIAGLTFACAALAGLWPQAAPALFLFAIAVALGQAIFHLRRPDRLKAGYLVREEGTGQSRQ